MTVVPRIALALGLAALIALVVGEGAGTLVALLSHAGWILLLLVPLQVVPMVFDVLGWRVLIAAPTPVSALFLIAWIRQAINRLLPVASVGGEIVGVRLLRQQGVAGMAAAASVIVELMLGLVAQYLFVALGVLCLFARVGHGGGWQWDVTSIADRTRRKSAAVVTHGHCAAAWEGVPAHRTGGAALSRRLVER